MHKPAFTTYQVHNTQHGMLETSLAVHTFMEQTAFSKTATREKVQRWLSSTKATLPGYHYP